jgi:hypothetical protein
MDRRTDIKRDEEIGNPIPEKYRDILWIKAHNIFQAAGVIVLVFALILVCPASSQMPGGDTKFLIPVQSTDPIPSVDAQTLGERSETADEYLKNPKSTEEPSNAGDQLSYVLRSEKRSLSFSENTSITDFFMERNPAFHGNIASYYLDYINEDIQDENLSTLITYIDGIGEITENDDARIAISIVQHLPYASFSKTVQYPYVTLTRGGDCDDKSTLLAYLLKNMGYGVALFYFEEEKHMAAGIKCNDEFGYQDSGYCFIETSHPSIVTDSYGSYVSTGKLTSNPEIIVVSEGKIFETAEEEYQDAQRWNEIRSSIQSDTTNPAQYSDWKDLSLKYGL